MALRFDRCTIDPDAFELRRDGEVVPVEPQVLELLLFLATNPGRLVTRDELVEAVWRGRIVSEATIASRIKAARRAIGGMISAQYLLCLALVFTGSFHWPLLLVLLNLPRLPALLGVLGSGKPTSPPEPFPASAWPLWFSAHAFSHTRRFTSLFLIGVLIDTLVYPG